MTDRQPDRRPSPLPRPSAAATPGPPTSASTTPSRRASGGSSRDEPLLGTWLGHPRRGRPPAATRAATRCSGRSTTSGRTSPRSRRSTRPSCRPTARFERDLELHNVRRELFDLDVLRLWERRSFALDTVGDSLFLLFARDHAPLAERLDADLRPAGGRARLPRGVEDPGDRPAGPPLAGARDRGGAATCPASSPRSSRPGPASWHRPRRRRLERAVAIGARPRSRPTPSGCAGRSPDGTDDWPIGRERYDALVGHRAFDGLDADQILELGWQKLAEEQAARVAAAREVDPDADEPTVLARIKADGPRRLRGGARGVPRRRCCAPARTSSSTTSSRSRTTSGSTSSRRRSTCATSCPSRRTSRRRRSTRTRRASTS